jgi:tripeptidyl-peptidase-2
LSSSANTETNRVFFLHTLYIDKHSRHTENSLQKRVLLSPGIEKSFYAPLDKSGCALEICLAQSWNSLGNTNINLELEFQGISAKQSSLSFSPSNPISRMDLVCSSSAYKVELSGSFSELEQVVFPSESETKIVQLEDERDFLPNKSYVFELRLSYSFDLSEKTSISPKANMLCQLLYESEFESQLWMIFNSSKKLVAVGDFRPKKTSLRAGSYTIRYQIRHNDIKKLELLKDMPISLIRALSKKVSLSVHDSFQAATYDSGKMSKPKISKGDRLSVFLKLPADFTKSLPKKLSKDSVYSLLGKISVIQFDGEKDSELFIDCKASDFASSSDGKKSEGKAKDVSSLAEKHRDALVKWLGSLEDSEFKEAFDTYTPKLFADFSENQLLSLLSLQLKNIDSAKDRNVSPLREIVQYCDKIISVIDLDGLAKYNGIRHSDSENNSKIAKDMSNTKDILVDTLNRKAIALFDLWKHEMNDRKAEDLSSLDDTVKSLKEWVDIEKQSKLRKIYINDLLRKEFTGKALKLALKNFFDNDSASPSKESYDELAQILESLGWKFWKHHFSFWRIRDFPSDFALF